ncbi:hypothetical protein FB45DRAFT_1064591 [Roridomyces roridus]|uniref:Protein kinase domain-containing protein n=1 Tax=Roridomyces roridus TaxID=1738132 RepID=A0AAD7FE94_9AGAR|nr:hypothetical protein FB45DRAFT_1064591 [Roridomyces roridus]
MDTLDFNHEDGWAYLVSTPSGPRIIHKPRKLYHIPCDFLWAHRVDISEIDVQNMECGNANGIWRGQDVDIHIGFNDLELYWVHRETMALKALRGMDVAYALIAHVFRGEKLIGTMTESSQLSRPVRATDHTAVVAAFALLERAFMVHRNVNARIIAVDEKGRVRLMYLAGLRHYGHHEREKLERDAQKYHWKAIEQLFNTFKQCDEIHSTAAPVPSRFIQPTADSSRFGTISRATFCHRSRVYQN